MFKWIGVAFGAVMFLAGLGWTLQSMDVWDGGTAWSDTLGPLVAGLGVALAFVAWRGLPE